MLFSKRKRNKNVTIDIQFHNHNNNDNNIGKSCTSIHNNINKHHNNINQRRHDNDNDNNTTNVIGIAQAGMSITGIVTITLKKTMKLLNNPHEVDSSTCSNDTNRNNTTAISTTVTSTIVPYFLGLISFELYGKEIVQMRKEQYIERWCYNHSIRYTKPTKKSSSLVVQHNKQQPTEYEFYSSHGLLDEFPISSYDPHTNSIHSGQYTFPFSIVLPNNLPTSISYNATNDKLIVPSTSTSSNGRNTSTSTIYNTKKKRMSPGFKIEYVLSIKLQNKFRTTGASSSTTTNCTSCYSMKSSIVMIQSKSNLLSGDQSVRNYPSDIIFTSTKDRTNPENGKMFIACAELDTVRINLSTNDNIDNDNDCHKLYATTSIPLRISCRNVSRVPIYQVNVNIIETVRWNKINFCIDTNQSEMNGFVSTYYMQPHDGMQRTVCTIPNILSSTIQIQRLGLFQRRLKNDQRWNRNHNNHDNSSTSPRNRVANETRNTYQQSIASLCCRDAVGKVLRDEILQDIRNTKNNDAVIPINIPYNNIHTILDEYTNGRLIHIDHHLEIVFITSTIRRRIRSMFSSRNSSSSSTTGTTTTTKRNDPKIIIPIYLYKNKTISSSSSSSNRKLEDARIPNVENSTTLEHDAINNNNSYRTDNAIIPDVGTFETLSTRGWIQSSASSTSMIPQSSSITDSSILTVQAEPVHWNDSHTSNNNNNDTDNDINESIPLVTATMIHDEDNCRINSHRHSTTRQDNSHRLPQDRYYYTATTSSTDTNDDPITVPVLVPVIPLSDLHPIPVPTLHDLQPIPAPKILP